MMSKDIQIFYNAFKESTKKILILRGFNFFFENYKKIDEHDSKQLNIFAY